MNVTISICLIIVFFVIGEILTWSIKTCNLFIRCHIAAIRILTIILAIITIKLVDKQNNYDCDLNKHDKELINAQHNLIQLQDAMIYEMENHLWYDLEDDLPMYDGDLKCNLDEAKLKVDSIYNSQL